MVTSITYVIGRVALSTTWIICEACLIAISFLRKLVSFNNPTVIQVNRYNLTVYRVTLGYTYGLSMYGGFVGGVAFDKVFATPHQYLVGGIAPLATEYICDKLFPKVLQRLGPVNAVKWATSGFDTTHLWGLLVFVILFVVNLFVLVENVEKKKLSARRIENSSRSNLHDNPGRRALSQMYLSP